MAAMFENMGGIWDLFSKPENQLLAAGALKSIGAVVEGSGAASYYRYQSRQAASDAEAERQMGAVRANLIRKAGRQVSNEATAQQGASGSSVYSGSAMAVQSRINEGVAHDALTELYAGAARGRVLDANAANYKTQAGRAFASGASAGASSLLGAAGKAAEVKESSDKWLRRREAETTRALSIFEPQTSYADF